MKKTSKKERRSRGDSESTDVQCHEVSVPGTFYQVTLSKCQIGNNNTVINSREEKVDHRDKPGNSRSRNHSGVLILETLFRNYDNKPMLFSELETKLKEYIALERLNTFREITGWSFNDFLIRNKDTFDVFKKKKIKYVKVRTKHKQINNKPLKTENESIRTYINDSPILNDEVFGQLEDERLESTNSDNETWTEVKPRRKKRPSSAISLKALPRAETNRKNDTKTVNSAKYKTIDNSQIPGTEQTFASVVTCTSEQNRRKSWSTERVCALIRNGECRNLMFVESVDIYLNNPIRFSMDIASMWNTPHRDKSYIVIGMTNDELVGIDISVDLKKFDDLFKKEYFNNVPKFEYFTVDFRSNVLLIIEIPSSCGFGNPCVVEKAFKGIGDIEVKERQIWVRIGKYNTVCKTNDLTDIYKWFLGQFPKTSMSVLEETKTLKIQPMRNAETNTPPSVMTSRNVYERSSSDEEPLCSSGDSFSFFWDAVKGFKKGHFILLAGNIQCEKRHLEALSLAPWICVYDFDIFSYTDGLLNALYDSLTVERHLSISSWNDSAENISERGTRWCFMRGRREMSDSRTDLKNDEIEDVNSWYKSVKKRLQNYCEKVANFAEDYTVPTIVFIWPENEKLVPFMVKFLLCLDDNLTSSPNIVLCLNRQPVSKIGRLKYELLCEDFSNNISLCSLRYEQMCIGIRSHSAVRTNEVLCYDLPKNERFESPPISETDATWLKEDFEVLFLNDPYDTENISKEEIQEEVSNFLRGGTLPWYAWYSREAESSVIDRDIQKNLEEKVNKLLDEYKTSIITLFHAPGSGGSTLAQKTLWHFHRKIPCVHLKLRTVSILDELDRKVSFLHDRTDLPVLLLIDGEEESKVRRLSRRLKYTVILYIKRYPYKIPSCNISYDRVYLSGKVSSTESQGLETKLGDVCGDSSKKKRLHQLTDDIKNTVSNHCMYEYGMTVYLHEFKGIVSYVAGYLELQNNPRKELTATQKCLGYLALVYYYGQTCVPCQFFSALFNKAPNFNMTLEDFPAPIQEFVVYDKNEGKRNNIRICHYIVAKEILEQILSRHLSHRADRSDTLDITACRNLSKFCMDFIEYASSKKTKISALSTTIRFVLTKTFIFRDEKDMGDNEEQVRKRPVLSKLMIDIPGGKPLFTERLNVLKKLTESFPDDPNYFAHLGRFHAFCRPDEDNEAEKCFRKAVKICEDQVKGKRDDEIDEGMKLTMMHIYHMYGIVKQRYISKFTGRSLKEKKVAFNEEFIFHERIEELIPVAETACEYFKKSRDITPDNHDVYTYAYTGEIQVRLQICEFVNRHFKNENATNRITEFLHSDADARAKLFVQRSISVIENLILECYMDIDLMDGDLRTLRHYVVWYNTIFKKQVLPLIKFSSEDDVSIRRLKIAAKKLKYGKACNLSGVETIDDETEIEEIVTWYEANFNDIQEFGFQDGDGKKELERDYRDWIFAIRHDKFKRNYSLEDVLCHVQIWNAKVRSPISTFYLFILKSLLGFGTEYLTGKTECLIEALECKEQLIKMNHLVIRPKYPREWLGNEGRGIKRLKSGNRHVGICAEDRDLASSRIDLATCKGTICRPNTNKVSGMIALDLGVNTVEVRVYFIPKVVRLEGSRFAEQRVEFNLAFSIQHGFEAYNVKLLKRHGCPQCGRKVEFTSTESLIICKCGMDLYKDSLNELK